MNRSELKRQIRWLLCSNLTRRVGARMTTGKGAETQLAQFKNEKKKACWKRVETDVTKTGNRKGRWKIGTKHNLKPSPISSFVSNSLLCSHYSFPSSPSSLLVPVPCFSNIRVERNWNYFPENNRKKSAENYLQTILAFLIYKRKIWKIQQGKKSSFKTQRLSVA